MDRLIAIKNEDDIFPEHRGTPIGRLIEYHNLGREYDEYDIAKILIGMCIDNRENLHIPDNFAFIIRTAGANLRNIEFNISFAIAARQLSYFALIGHDNCGMVNLGSQKKQFIDGLMEVAGWDKETAEQHFHDSVPKFEIGNEVDFLIKEAKRLRHKYPKVRIAPLLFSVDDNNLYLINET